MNDEHLTYPDFGDIRQEIQDGHRRDHVYFIIHDGYLFRGYKLCIPHTSIRDFLIWELHSRGLSGYFGKDKTIPLIEDRFY